MARAERARQGRPPPCAFEHLPSLFAGRAHAAHGVDNPHILPPWSEDPRQPFPLWAAGPGPEV